MSSDELVAPCPPSVHREPPVSGLEREGDVWRLSLAVHRELVRDVTGVEPTDSLDLQDLTTIAARLEGFVEQRKREEVTATNATADVDPPVGGLSRLRTWLSTLVRTVLGRDHEESAGATPVDSMAAFESYSTETVWYLSQFFRAAADERYDAVVADTAVTADTPTPGYGTES